MRNFTSLCQQLQTYENGIGPQLTIYAYRVGSEGEAAERWGYSSNHAYIVIFLCDYHSETTTNCILL
jgi:hypothetical protein